MPVDLTPVDELSLPNALTEAIDNPYCGHCTHIDTTSDTPQCTYHDAPTELQRGYVCPQYLPQGMEHLDNSDQ